MKDTTIRTVDQLVEKLLAIRSKRLGAHLKAEVLLVASEIRPGLDAAIRVELEKLKQSKKICKTLAICLETIGGHIDVVDRIHTVLRQHFDEVYFVVPDFAYSAGTVLALSGDRIYMDYYSVLGSIDPQIEDAQGALVPGLGYISKFEELVKRIDEKPPGKAQAETAYLLNKFDPGRLFLLEQAKSRSIALLEEWLSTYKFKDWTKTETGQNPVNAQARRERAQKIADALCNPKLWHSHSRGIGIAELRGDKIKLKIDDFSEERALEEKVRLYYDLAIDYRNKLGARSIIHTERGLRRL
ncbi:MAG: hypothetical protein FWG75_00695 [Cystobacterineae bacterium]|nr:hypothetical protein [Cystobacterineae bacterium]